MTGKDDEMAEAETVCGSEKREINAERHPVSYLVNPFVGGEQPGETFRPP